MRKEESRTNEISAATIHLAPAIIGKIGIENDNGTPLPTKDPVH